MKGLKHHTSRMSRKLLKGGGLRQGDVVSYSGPHARTGADARPHGFGPAAKPAPMAASPARHGPGFANRSNRP